MDKINDLVILIEEEISDLEIVNEVEDSLVIETQIITLKRVLIMISTMR